MPMGSMMQQLRKVVAEERSNYENHPWLAFLRDASIPAEYRLAYAPYAVHFILTFADLNRLMIGDEPGGDPYTPIVSRHGQEDAQHWAWYLKDLETLGWNPMAPFAETVRFIWGPGLRRTRALGYQMAALLLPASPQLRYCLIEGIEAMGNAWLNATIVAAEDAAVAEKLVYFGAHHLSRETGHAIGSEDHQDTMSRVVLDPETRTRGIAGIRSLFAHMAAFNTELLEHSRAHLRSGVPPRFFLSSPSTTH